MADPAPPVIRDVLDHAWEVAQRLAIEVIEYPADKRDQVMQCMGSLLVEVARQAGCPMRQRKSSATQWSRPFAVTFQRLRQAAAELSAQLRMWRSASECRAI